MPHDDSSLSSDLLWIEEGEQREGLVAEVAPLVPVYRTYLFTVPQSIESSLSLGQRVIVPMGRQGRPVPAFVVGLDRRIWDSTLRPIVSIMEPGGYLTPELIDLGRRIAHHYHCPLGRTLKSMTPEAVRQRRGLKTVPYARLRCSLEEWRKNGRRTSARGKALIELLGRSTEPVRVENLLRESGASPAMLRAMTARGWVEIIPAKEAPDSVVETPQLVEPSFELNEEQQAALARIHDAIQVDRFSVTLLFGVSGSGKTEVYIRAIRQVLSAGRQAMLLLPEIVLTTQLVARLASRLPDLAVHHSGLTDVERSLIWRQVASGAKKVVVGTRSAVFAPCPNLGLICVDEEQETSYKNLQAPRFHVRDTAILRARMRGIPIVLGSATPSLEMWHTSERRPECQRVTLRHRVLDLPLPRVHIVDMCDEWTEQKQAVIFSRPMEQGLRATLERGEQALLLINRRGFARRLRCPACRTQLMCPRCNVAMVVHSPTSQLVCHYCRQRTPIPLTCPNLTCGAELTQMGIGTQRVEELLARRFPKANIRRVDSDTMRHRRQYQQVIDEFEARKIDILVGTQMIAKGLDFPHVSFVGVVDADPTGIAGDFRADERLFQLITQVAGRAGRAEASGRVVVQTTMPELPSLRFALKHDYESFAALELQAREKAKLPPFHRLARIVVVHQRDQTAQEEVDRLAVRVKDGIAALLLESADVLGPNPCTLARLRGRYRYDLLLRTLRAADMHRWMDHLQSTGAFRTKAESLVIDVDPVALA